MARYRIKGNSDNAPSLEIKASCKDIALLVYKVTILGAKYQSLLEDLKKL